MFECGYRHAPVVEFRQVARVLRVIEIGMLARCHNKVVPVFMCKFNAFWGEGVTPCYKCDIIGVGEQIVVRRWPYVVELAP